MALKRHQKSNKIEFKKIKKKRNTNYKKVPKRLKKQSFFTKAKLKNPVSAIARNVRAINIVTLTE